MKKLLLLTIILISNQLLAQFSQSFEGSTTTPAGWTVLAGGDSGQTWVLTDLSASSTLGAQNGTNVFSINYGSTAHNDYLVTPQFVVTQGVTDKLSFWGRSRDPLYPETISVKASSTTATVNAFTITLLSTVAPTSGANFYKYEIDLSDYLGQSLYVGFHSTTTDKFVFDLDNIVLGSTPSCSEPTSPLTFTNVADNEVTVSWTGLTTAPANGYEIYYSTSGTAPAQDAVANLSVGAGVTSTLVTGLAAGTKYYFYVRSKCSDTTSSVWGHLGMILTTFTPAVPTYSYGFDNAAGYIADGWSGAWSTNATVGNPQAGTQMIFSNNSQTAATNRWMFSRPISLVANTTYTITFYLRNFGTVAQSIKLTSATTNVAANHTNAIWTTTTFANTAWTQQTATFTPTATGIYYFGIQHFSPLQASQVSLALDTFSINAPLGVEEFVNNKINVYPNPASDILNISTNSKLIDSVTIIDINGRSVKTIENNTNQLQISISDLTSGVYFLKIISDGNVTTEKFIKQ